MEAQIPFLNKSLSLFMQLALQSDFSLPERGLHHRALRRTSPPAACQSLWLRRSAFRREPARLRPSNSHSRYIPQLSVRGGQQRGVLFGVKGIAVTVHNARLVASLGNGRGRPRAIKEGGNSQRLVRTIKKVGGTHHVLGHGRLKLVPAAHGCKDETRRHLDALRSAADDDAARRVGVVSPGRD